MLQTNDTTGAAATGIILAGGRSTRLGSDKALAAVGGLPLIVRVARALRAVCPLLIVAGRAPATGGGELAGAVGVTWVPDRRPGSGPLAGILGGLEASPTEVNLVVACDMPFLDPAALRELLRRLDGWEAVAPVHDGRVQATCAGYRRSLLPALRDAFAAGLRSPTDFLQRVRTRYVPAAELGSPDPGRVFLGVNTPAALDEAQRLAAG